MFSGIFGIGKTTFIKEYFRNSDSYIGLHLLFPINYSVSKNEDIFELIKFDILYEILGQKPDLSQVHIGVFDVLRSLTEKDIYEIFKHFISVVPVIGKATINVLKPLEVAIDVIKKKAVDLKSESDGEMIKQFAEKLQMSVGSIYENDFYTQLINSLIASIKTSTGKKVVLIVDDLDRIDPEHIFRILNIFAAHFDSKLYYENRNKFGFDKVILCCDIENIRRIYTYKYGNDVDFNGYIDKLFSKDIYYFNNVRNLITVVNSVLKSLILLGGGRQPSKLREQQHLVVVNIVTSAIIGNVINLRALLNWVHRDVSVKRKRFQLGGKQIDCDLVDEVFQVLENILQGEERLSAILEKISILPVTDHRVRKYLFPDLLLFADVKSHDFSLTTSVKSTFDNNIYSYGLNGGGRIVITSINGTHLDKLEDTEIPYKELLIAAYKSYVVSEIDTL